jgi:hypothetical protein
MRVVVEHREFLSNIDKTDTRGGFVTMTNTDDAGHIAQVTVAHRPDGRLAVVLAGDLKLGEWDAVSGTITADVLPQGEFSRRRK